MDKRENKKALILDAMRKLIIDGKAADCSVSEIAKTAGIGKGSIYYYYKSKREIEIDLFYKIYSGFVGSCEFISNMQANALRKLKVLFSTYYSQSIDLAMESYLHLPQNADMHQKVLALIVNAISPILSKILKQGTDEGIFDCDMQNEYAQIYICVFAFLFDGGIFELTEEDVLKKLTAFARVMEKSLKAEKGMFSFVYDKEFLLSLPFIENRTAPFNLPSS